MRIIRLPSFGSFTGPPVHLRAGGLTGGSHCGAAPLLRAIPGPLNRYT